MQTPEHLPKHSPLGGSAAPRFMKCTGSVRLGFEIPEDEEDDTFSKPGIAAHLLAEKSLKYGDDPWHWLGSELGGVVVDKEMADAVYVYTDRINRHYPKRSDMNSRVEFSFYCPELHKYFYGKADFIYLYKTKRILHCWDFKYGAGVVVEPEWNEQLLYYACGVLEKLDLWFGVDEVVVHVAQPRAWHWDSAIRSWRIPTSDLDIWMFSELIPAMDKAMTSTELNAGMHCRFCPVRGRQCPELDDALEELEQMMDEFKGKTAPKMTPSQVGHFLDLFDLAKLRVKPVEQRAFQLLQKGKKVPNRKLVKARANREFRDGAESVAVKRFGKKRAFTTSILKSPAQIEELPGGKEFNSEYAFKPDRGLTVGRGDDTRARVSRDTKSLFKPVRKPRSKK